jgi:hypothetical protein
VVEAPDRNHFNLLSDLAYPDRPLTHAVLEMVAATAR